MSNEEYDGYEEIKKVEGSPESFLEISYDDGTKSVVKKKHDM